MAPVPIKFVVTFSSQDPRHPVENLIKPDSAAKWLCAPGDRSGKLEAVFQLERAYKLSHLDLGTWWAFCVQVLVGRSSWPQNQEYQLLVSATNLMSPVDCRSGKNKAGIRMLKYDNFEATTRDEQWDRVKVVLTQPFRKDAQFGMSMMRLVTEDVETPEKNPLSVPRIQKNEETQERGAVRTGLSPGRKPNIKATPPRSTNDIKEHFFGKKKQRDERTEKLKSQLVKLNASAENGIESIASLPRHAQLVMSAVNKVPQYRSASGVQSPGTVAPRRKKLSFSEEVDEFLNSIDVKTLDLDKVTFADLRHRLEKKKVRKLTKDEKSIFFTCAQKFVEQLVQQQENMGAPGNRVCRAEDQDVNVIAEYPSPKHQDIMQTDKTRRRLESSTDSKVTPMKRKNGYLTQNDSDGSPGTVRNNRDQQHPPKRRNVHGIKDHGKESPPVTPCRFEEKYRKMPVNYNYSSPGDDCRRRGTEGSSPCPSRTVAKTSNEGGKSTGGKGTPKRGLADKHDDANLNTWLCPSGGPSPVAAKTSVGYPDSQYNAYKNHGRKVASSPAPRMALEKNLSDNSAPTPPSPPSVIDGKVVCPLCNGLFPPFLIEHHAASCGVLISSDSEVECVNSSPQGFAEGNVEGVECPMCGDRFPVMGIDEHADTCAEVSFTQKSRYAAWL